MFMKEITTIFSVMPFNDLDATKFPEQELKKIVNRGLSRCLADFIMENMEEIPMTRTQKRNLTTREIETKVEMVIISEKELYRLQKIEKQLSELLENEVRGYSGVIRR
jgi:hypothetical protein